MWSGGGECETFILPMWKNKEVAGCNQAVAGLEHQKNRFIGNIESKSEAQSFKIEKTGDSSSHNYQGIYSMAPKKQKNVERGRRK